MTRSMTQVRPVASPNALICEYPSCHVVGQIKQVRIWPSGEYVEYVGGYAGTPDDVRNQVEWRLRMRQLRDQDVH